MAIFYNIRSCGEEREKNFQHATNKSNAEGIVNK